MPRPRKNTNTQVLDAVVALVGSLGMPPTIAELRKYLKVGSNRTVQRYLKHLEDEGMIERWPGARGLRILAEDYDECPWCGRTV